MLYEKRSNARQTSNKEVKIETTFVGEGGRIFIRSRQTLHLGRSHR